MISKAPYLVRKYYRHLLWKMPNENKEIYLTFDDGPTPGVTGKILELLENHNAKATFFCIGKNVMEHPGIYKSILFKGHATGNHTHNHLNGWNVEDALYFHNIFEASRYIDSRIFRPPYGKITSFHAKQVIERMNYKIIMWSVLSGDFDKKLSAEDCYKKTVNASAPGSIIVFHDSEKAFPTLKQVLPKTLQYLSDKGYSFEKIQ